MDMKDLCVNHPYYCSDSKQKEEIIAVVFKSFNGPFVFVESGDSGFRDHRGKYLCINCIRHLRQINFKENDTKIVTLDQVRGERE